MINLETLKQEIYQRERKRLFRRFLLVNFLVVLFLSITLSGTKVTEREKELIKLNRELVTERDSLRNFATNELTLMKETENKLIRKSLSISMDTTFVDNDLNVNNLYAYAEDQLHTYSNIENVVDNKWDSISRIPTGMPISLADLYDYNDGFGYRKHPILKKILFHEGIDIGAWEGSDVLTTGDGIVEKVIESDKGYGNRIVIDHGNGYKTVYAHLSKFNVVVGQKVKKYDVIASTGSTGLSTGPHLHYEILMKNRPVDPYKYFYIDAKTVVARK